MKLIKIGAAVVNQTPLDWDSNRRHIVAAIEAARAERVSVLCLPEMCIPGYGCEDTFHSPGMQRKALELLAEIVPACEGMIVSVGLPLMFHKALYNTACLIVDGRIAGFVGKRFLAGDGIHYEPRWFKPWPAGHHAMVEVDAEEYPLGDIHFDCGGVKIGFEICEDAWVANRPGSQLALHGVDIILNPSASHFAFDKYRVRRRFVTEGSRAFGVAYVYANLLGCEAGRIVYDGGALIATGGELVACGPRFSYSDFELTTTVLDITANRMRQSRTGSYRPNVDDDAEVCIEVDFNYPAREPMSRPVVESSWEQSDTLKEEEFTRAISLGLFDYLRKSRSRGFVVSLSGGADSSGVACLVAHAVELGIADIGLAAFKARLGYLTELGECSDSRAIVSKLLLCVYQATRNSSATTRDAACAVADEVGAEFMVLDVDFMVEGYVGMIGDAIGRQLSWAADDVALQNIQARARGPGVWMLANLRGALLLATSNRSEAAVGYATMDGDTCGGLSPIAGIDKDFLRQWLRWLESNGVAGLSPLPALAAVNVQAPTAELRPHEANQTDEADLMPYRILDVIEGAAIRDKHTPLEVFLELRSQFPDYSSEQLGAWIERFFRLWCRNQWKRERYAPAFHVDDKNLDPRSWCRFPILSGGFERELAELRDYIARQ